MKRFLITITLTCALFSSALGGEIPSVGAPTPAPNGITQTPGATQTPPGDIPTDGKAGQISSDALSALLSAFSFLAV